MRRVTLYGTDAKADFAGIDAVEIHRQNAERIGRKAHRVIDVRTASRISLESARSSTARARIIPPTRLA